MGVAPEDVLRMAVAGDFLPDEPADMAFKLQHGAIDQAVASGMEQADISAAKFYSDISFEIQVDDIDAERVRIAYAEPVPAMSHIISRQVLGLALELRQIETSIMGEGGSMYRAALTGEGASSEVTNVVRSGLLKAIFGNEEGLENES